MTSSHGSNTTNTMNLSVGSSVELGTQPPLAILAAKRANTVALGKTNVVHYGQGIQRRPGSSNAYHSDAESK
jgi:hypothetical protein